MEIDTEKPAVDNNESAEENIDIDVGDDTDSLNDTNGEDDSPEKPSAGQHSPGNRHGFFIQDILRPEFGATNPVKEQYYAYLQYCYQLQMHNMMLLQGAAITSQNAFSNGTQTNNVSQLLNDFRQAQQKRMMPQVPFNHAVPKPIPQKVMYVSPIKSYKEQSDTKANFPYRRYSAEESTESKFNLNSPSLRKEKDKSDIQATQPRTTATTHNNVISRIDLSINQSQDSNIQLKNRNVINNIVNKETIENETVLSSEKKTVKETESLDKGGVWPAWVYCTRYSDRPSSGPRSRKIRRRESSNIASSTSASDKRPRIAFTNEQLAALKREFDENRYLTEERRAKLAQELDLTDAQVKIWFQNKRAKLKKTVGLRNPLALSLMAQGLYNHATSAKQE